MKKKLKLTAIDLNRLPYCYMLSKGKDDPGCGVKFRVVPLSGSRICLNVETNFRVSMIRLDEFSRVTNIVYATASIWVHKGIIKSKKIDGHRWLDVDSVVEFLKTYPIITVKQREEFDDRLIAVYDYIVDTAKANMDIKNIVFTVL